MNPPDILFHYQKIEDPRVERTKRYPLIEIIFLIVTATISGCEGWKSIQDFGVVKRDWLRQFLPYENGIPVDDAIERVLRKLDTKQFSECFVRGVQNVEKETEGEVIAIDGKT